jgi:hypothetical protein
MLNNLSQLKLIIVIFDRRNGQQQTPRFDFSNKGKKKPLKLLGT